MTDELDELLRHLLIIRQIVERVDGRTDILADEMLAVEQRILAVERRVVAVSTGVGNVNQRIAKLVPRITAG
jgi:hypothetical protein